MVWCRKISENLGENCSPSVRLSESNYGNPVLTFGFSVINMRIPEKLLKFLRYGFQS